MVSTPFQQTYTELHSGELMDVLANLVFNDGPCDIAGLVVCLLHGSLAHVVECHNILQHAHGLVEWTVAIVLGVGVLLQEVVLDELGNFKSDFVRLC